MLPPFISRLISNVAPALLISLRRLIPLVIIVLHFTLTFSASSHEGKSLRATRSKNPPTLDGILSEEIWARASPTEAFTQKEPHVGEEASESTVIRVIYTDKSLFLGISCSDSSAKDIVATERRRDGDLLKDDSIWILIDS